jgi:hypothetical protein
MILILQIAIGTAIGVFIGQFAFAIAVDMLTGDN